MAAMRLARSAWAEASTAAPALSPSPFLRQSRSCCPAFCCNSSNLCSSHRVSRLGTSSVAQVERTPKRKSFLPCAMPFQHCATTSWLRHLSLRTAMSLAVGACHSFSWRDKCVVPMWCPQCPGRRFPHLRSVCRRGRLPFCQLIICGTAPPPINCATWLAQCVQLATRAPSTVQAERFRHRVCCALGLHPP